MRRVFACALASGGGSPLVGDAQDTTSETGTTTSTTTSSTSGTTAGIGPTTGTSSSTSEDGGADDHMAPKLDTRSPDVHYVETCEVSPLEEIDLVITGPDGPVAATHAWWGWDACCYLKPWLAITDEDAVNVVNGQLVTSYLGALTLPDEYVTPYSGAMPIKLITEGNRYSEVIDPGVESLEPIDPDAAVDGEQPLFAASFAVDAQGWTIQGMVRAPYCELLYRPPCPCE